MSLSFGSNEHHPMVDALLRPRVPRWEGLNRAIDERDDMLDFTLDQFDRDRDLALLSYFQNAMEQFRLVRHIARWRGRIPRMLDFASGYGRLTRLLVHEHLADEVTVSDILEGGMEFQAAQFGVQTILSTTAPEGFHGSGKYDLIFVASLFTHLPAETFTRWLARLGGLLTPTGMLAFTVHDASLAPEPFQGGIRFDPSSESRVLDVNDYGSTWVRESYVREQVAAIDPAFACVRMPRALGDWQDVYVVSPSPLPARPRRVPKGFIERFEVSEGHVRIEGWATAVDRQVDRIELRVDDEIVAVTRDFGPRPDVAAFVGTVAAKDSGWGVAAPIAAIRSFRYQLVTVSAFTEESIDGEGEELILFLGTLASREGQIARQVANAFQQQVEALRGELATARHELAVAAHESAERAKVIEAMQASRFWKAREKWFVLKRSIGLVE